MRHLLQDMPGKFRVRQLRFPTDKVAIAVYEVKYGQEWGHAITFDTKKEALKAIDGRRRVEELEA